MPLPRWARVLGIFAAGAVVALLVFHGWPPRPQLTVIRSYEVQPDIAREVFGVVQQALQPSNLPPLGSATLAPGPRLVVTATPLVQSSVANTLAQISARRVSPTPSIAFDFWLVTARPASGASEPASSALAEVAPALEELRKARGPLHFELAEKLSLLGRPGDEDSQVSGKQASFRVQPTLRRAEDGSTRVAAEIQVTSSSGQLKSLVELRPGELLVVGERVTGAYNDGNTDLYYIVRARL